MATTSMALFDVAYVLDGGWVAQLGGRLSSLCLLILKLAALQRC